MRRLRLLIGTLASVALLAALAVSPAYAQSAVGRAIVAQERHNDRLLATPGVVGTAVGHGAEGRAAVFVFTVEPGVAGIPAKLDGVPVVAHVTGEIFALPKGGKGGKPPKDSGGEVDPKSWFDRPVPIGVSSGNVKLFLSDDGRYYCSVGTLGARVTDGIYVYALSNNHVYAHTNTAAIGDTIVQPGTVDLAEACSDNSTDSIGTLYAFKPLKLDGSNNTIDAAIASTEVWLVGNSTPSDGYGTPKSTTVNAVINAKLEKYGRTTGPTTAIVWAINSTVDVIYDADADGNPTKIARFVGQIVAKGSGFSRGGDSGSLVVQVMGRGKNKGYYPVGLLFAGSSFFELTWLNPINDVLSELAAELGLSVGELQIDGE